MQWTSISKWVLFLVVACSSSVTTTAAARLFPNLQTANPMCAKQALYSSHTQSGSIILTPDLEFVFSPHAASEQDAVAYGSFLDGSHTVSNFGQLHITTSGDFSDDDQVFAAGYLEGYLTAPRIYQNLQNLHTYFTNTLNASLDEPMQWIHRQDEWVRDQCTNQLLDTSFAMPPGQQHIPTTIKETSTTKAEATEDKKFEDRVWDAVCLAIRQFDGVVAGYQARSLIDSTTTVPPLEYADFLFLESNGDLYDIIDKLDPSQRPSWSPGGDDDDDNENNSNSKHSNAPTEEDAARLFNSIALSGKCSALVKVAADLSDIYMGHATWDSYTAMLRIYKHYTFDLRTLNPPAQRLSFSSYPGEVFSDDDFFILSSQMVVLQTTNKIFNDALFDTLTHESVLSWQRVRAANWMAASGEEWQRALAQENSGTYNNQYIVVDLKRFVPGEDLRPGLLWVAEQIPGKVVAKDMTATLTMGYWPSYNVPAFEEIYNASGYPDFISKLEKYGQHFSRSTHWLSYEASPRAAIFRRDQTAVTSLETMKALMRSNNWKKDPLSEGHPICAICGRGDLDAHFPEARGCYDTKVTSWKMAMEGEAEAVNGPTTGAAKPIGGVNPAAKLPAFTWEAAQAAVGQDLLHLGQPERFNFRFERMSPRQDVDGYNCGGGFGREKGEHVLTAT